MLGQIVKWFVYMALLLGVLVIVGLGIAWTLAGGDDIKAKMSLKNWLINVIVGFIILTFFAAILKFLAPWIFL